MAKTLLEGVNDVLKRVRLVQGDSGALDSLTDSARQTYIDQVVQIWNEVVEEVYSVTDEPMPNELAEATITLADGDRDYALASYNTIHWPLLDETSGQYIYEYPGDYLDLVNSQSVPSDFTGLPQYGVIRPTDGQLYLDRIPSSTEAGLVYKYRYDKDVSLSIAADTFPFRDEVYRALVPVVAGLYKSDDRAEALRTSFAFNLGRAARLLSDRPVLTHYGKPKQMSANGIMAPFSE